MDWKSPGPCPSLQGRRSGGDCRGLPQTLSPKHGSHTHSFPLQAVQGHLVTVGGLRVAQRRGAGRGLTAAPKRAVPASHRSFLERCSEESRVVEI